MKILPCRVVELAPESISQRKPIESLQGTTWTRALASTTQLNGSVVPWLYKMGIMLIWNFLENCSTYVLLGNCLMHAPSVQHFLETSQYTTIYKCGLYLCSLYTEFKYSQKAMGLLCIFFPSTACPCCVCLRCLNMWQLLWLSACTLWPVCSMAETLHLE